MKLRSSVPRRPAPRCVSTIAATFAHCRSFNCARNIAAAPWSTPAAPWTTFPSTSGTGTGTGHVHGSRDSGTRPSPAPLGLQATLAREAEVGRYEVQRRSTACSSGTCRAWVPGGASENDPEGPSIPVHPDGDAILSVSAIATARDQGQTWSPTSWPCTRPSRPSMKTPCSTPSSVPTGARRTSTSHARPRSSPTSS